MDLKSLIQLVGPVAALALIGLMAFVREQVFTKAAMERERAEKLEWKAMALQGLGVVEKSVETAAVAVKTPARLKRGEDLSDEFIIRTARERGLIR